MTHDMADKTTHVDIVQNPDIKSFLDECNYMVIAEKQAKLLCVDGVGMILVPHPPNVAHRVVRAPDDHHRVMVYDKVCDLLHHALSSFLFC